MKRLENIKDFERLRETARAAREPSARLVTVCCGTGCVASGAGDVFARLKEEIGNRNIKAEVGSKATGCHGFCERGPLVVVFPERIFYQRVTPEDIPEIVEETLLKAARGRDPAPARKLDLVKELHQIYETVAETFRRELRESGPSGFDRPEPRVVA